MTTPRQTLAKRLWIYQAERFPLGKTIPLLATFSAASVTASANLSHRAPPGPAAYLVAFLLAMTFFFQMRAADEVKDAETDRRHRPERPIPRGLVSLKLIASLGIAAFLPAAAAAFGLAPTLLGLVVLVWLWLGLMTAEFFAHERLSSSPLLYLVSHMAIMPLIDLALTGCEWLPAKSGPPEGLWTFLWMSFCNGSVIEFGRKIWAPEQERPGVDTYSSGWGICTSLAAFALATLGAFAGLIACGVVSGRPLSSTILGFAALGLPGYAALKFVRHPTAAGQKRIETTSGLWVLLCYIIAAAMPLIPTGAP